MYVDNLPDYNTGHNMMKQKDVLRQSSVRILLFECPLCLCIHGKKMYLLSPFELYSRGGWTQVNSGEFHLNMATPPLLLLPQFPENSINKTNLPCLLFFAYISTSYFVLTGQASFLFPQSFVAWHFFSSITVLILGPFWNTFCTFLLFLN